MRTDSLLRMNITDLAQRTGISRATLTTALLHGVGAPRADAKGRYDVEDAAAFMREHCPLAWENSPRSDSFFTRREELLLVRFFNRFSHGIIAEKTLAKIAACKSPKQIEDALFSVFCRIDAEIRNDVSADCFWSAPLRFRGDKDGEKGGHRSHG